MFVRILKQIARLLLADAIGEISNRLLEIANQLDSGACQRPPVVAQQLLISAEDHRAARHQGVDVIAIGRALYLFVLFGKRQGASTIEQQIVRVLTGRYERTLTRKMREMLLALIVAEILPKHRLPEIYLLIAYYGAGMQGYSAAYYKLSACQEERDFRFHAAMIARLKYPEPKVLSHRRAEQIRLRTDHLLSLHGMHSTMGVYDYIVEHSIRVNEPVASRIGSSS